MHSGSEVVAAAMIAPDGWYCRPFSVSAERSTISARAGGRCSPAHHSRQWATVRSREFVRSDGPGRLRVSEKLWTSPSAIVRRSQVPCTPSATIVSPSGSSQTSQPSRRSQATGPCSP